MMAEQVVVQCSRVGASMRRYRKMAMSELRELARARHPEYTPAAASVFADRALDMEVETRLWLYHENPGYQPFSSTAKIGEQPGGGTAAAEPLAIMYDKYRELSPEHKAAQRFIQGARLHPRQLLALLIRGAKSYPRRRGEFAKSYDEIARDLPRYAQMLGFGPVAVMDDVRRGAGKKSVFANGKALKNAATQGRTEVLLLAQV